MATQPIGIPGGQPTPDPLGRSAADRAQDTQRSGASAVPLGNDPKPRGDTTGDGEKVQISRKARELLRMSELMTSARNKLDSEPDLRAERVREVKERLKAGVYETRGVRDELAHRLSSILRDLPAIDSED